MKSIKEKAEEYGLQYPVIHYDKDGNTYDDVYKPSMDFEAGVNNKCRAFTSLEQSRKLAEILPLESADMVSPFQHTKNDEYIPEYVVSRNYVEVYNEMMKLPGMEKKDVCQLIQPTWSLAALLSVLESEIDGEEGETYQLNIEKDGTWWNVWYREQYDEANPIETESTEELIDACVEMVIKLNERNLL